MAHLPTKMVPTAMRSPEPKMAGFPFERGPAFWSARFDNPPAKRPNGCVVVWGYPLFVILNVQPRDQPLFYFKGVPATKDTPPHINLDFASSPAARGCAARRPRAQRCHPPKKTIMVYWAVFGSPAKVTRSSSRKVRISLPKKRVNGHYWRT